MIGLLAHGVWFAKKVKNSWVRHVLKSCLLFSLKPFGRIRGISAGGFLPFASGDFYIFYAYVFRLEDVIAVANSNALGDNNHTYGRFCYTDCPPPPAWP